MRNKSIRRISNSRLSNRMVRMFSVLCAASLLLTCLPAEYVYAEETGIAHYNKRSPLVKNFYHDENPISIEYLYSYY